MIRIGDVEVGSRVWLAPMTGVSDLPFRKTAAGQGARYVATEMVASELLAAGRRDVVRRAAVDDFAALKVVQLVGREARWMAEGARMAEAAGADIVDLNFGCPAKEVTGGLSGSALMRDLDRALVLIRAAVEATSRPVTIKMRLGWDDAARNAPELAARAEEAGVQGFTVHGRTRQQFYKGRADWRAVGAVKAAVRAPVIVNGDVVDLESAKRALEQSGADGVMIGRGAYGRPWIAREIEAGLSGAPFHAPAGDARLALVLGHLWESVRFYGEFVGVRTFRKHLGWYVEGGQWPEGVEDRRAWKSRLCRLDTAREIKAELGALWSEGRLAA
jgi:nifR3 family TIM-barrel protein